MNNITIFLSIIIVVCVLIFFSSYDKLTARSTKQSCGSSCKCGPSCKCPDKSKCGTSCKGCNKHADKPKYYDNYNHTQLTYMKLMDVLAKMSHKTENRIRLPDNSTRRVIIPGTGDNTLYREVDEITNLILKKINYYGNFYFFKVYYDNVVEICDKEGNKNFYYQVYIEDPQSGYGFDIRLLIDVIKFAGPINKHRSPYPTCAKLTTPEVPKYVAGYPQCEQLIPLPTEVITTGLEVLSTYGINEKLIAPICGLYINEVRIYNTNNVLQADGTGLPDALCGPLAGSLESSRIVGPNTPYIEPSCVRNPWPTLYNQPLDRKAWPCTEQPETWNRLGLLTPTPCEYKKCPGVRSSYQQVPLRAEYWPTHATIPREDGPNAWLFDRTRGDVASEGADFTN